MVDKGAAGYGVVRRVMAPSDIYLYGLPRAAIESQQYWRARNWVKENFKRADRIHTNSHGQVILHYEDTGKLDLDMWKKPRFLLNYKAADGNTHKVTATRELEYKGRLVVMGYIAGEAFKELRALIEIPKFPFVKVDRDTYATYVAFSEALALEYKAVSTMRNVTIGGISYRAFTEVMGTAVAPSVKPISTDNEPYAKKLKPVDRPVTNHEPGPEYNAPASVKIQELERDVPVAIPITVTQPDKNSMTQQPPADEYRRLYEDAKASAAEYRQLYEDEKGYRERYEALKDELVDCRKLYDEARSIGSCNEGKYLVYKGMMEDLAVKMARVEMDAMRREKSLESLEMALLSRSLLEDFIRDHLKHPDEGRMDIRGNRNKIFCPCASCMDAIDKLVGVIRKEYKLVSHVTSDEIRRSLVQAYEHWSKIAHPAEKKSINLKALGDMEYIVYGMAKLQNWGVST